MGWGSYHPDVLKAAKVSKKSSKKNRVRFRTRAKYRYTTQTNGTTHAKPHTCTQNTALIRTQQGRQIHICICISPYIHICIYTRIDREDRERGTHLHDAYVFGAKVGPVCVTSALSARGRGRRKRKRKRHRRRRR